MRRFTIFACVAAIVVLVVWGASADVPRLVNYQGILTDDTGVPVTGTHDVTFTIYPADGSSPPVYWTETHTGVQVDDGLFNVVLGGVVTIPDSLFAGGDRWMGITVDGGSEMTPRMQITSVPWTFRAAVADSANDVGWNNISDMPAGFADGIDDVGSGSGDSHSLDAADGDPEDVVYVDDVGNVGVGTTSPLAKLHVASGSTVLFGADSLGAGSKLMWLPSKSAFRVGRVAGVEWNWANIGDYSTAMGSSTTASGPQSTAMGSSTTASGYTSTAMGEQSTASGDYSTAMGRSTTASAFTSTAMGYSTTASGPQSTAMGSSTTASGDLATAMGWNTTASGEYATALGENTSAESQSSTAIGRNNVGGGTASGWVSTDPLFEIGNGTDDANRANALTVLKNGNVGIGTTTPEYELDVADTVQMSGFKMPTGASVGYVLTSDATGVGSWQSGSAASDGDWQISGNDMYSDVPGNVGIGTSSPIAPLHLASGSTVLFGADTLGAGSKLMWLPSKSAFRVGKVDGNEWDAANIGEYSTAIGWGTTAMSSYSTSMGKGTMASGYTSTAMGYYTTASGPQSTALGSSTEASGDLATAMGWTTTASGEYATALGSSTEASGVSSTAMGSSTTASGLNSTAMGENTSAESQSSTAMGKGTMALSPYSTAMGNGSTASGYTSTALGSSTTASGPQSTAMGSSTTASGEIATAMGWSTEASGEYATALGEKTSAESQSSTAIGRYNVGGGTASGWVSTDPLFEIGNGTDDANRANAMTVLKNGNVGIGTPTPANQLHVVGIVQIGTIETIADVGAYTLGCAASWIPNSDNLRQLGRSDKRWTEVWATDGTINMSDARLKENVSDSPYGLNEIMALRPVSFRWRDHPEDGTRLGLIAQEVQPVINEAVADEEVSYNEGPNGPERTVKPAENLGMYYSQLIPVLIKAVQEQQGLIELQAEKIKELELRISKVED